MKIIVDERETELFNKCQNIITSENNKSVELHKRVLPLGDILITTNDDKDILLVERKSFSDLLASIKDGRYEEQSYRLMHSSLDFPKHSIVYLLEGLFSQLRNPVEKKTIYSAMTSLFYFKGFSVFKTSNVNETAEWLISTATKIEKDMAKGKAPYYVGLNIQPSEDKEVMPTIASSGQTHSDYCNVVKKIKKENVTPENIGEIMLSQIPGISSVTAIAIMKKYGTLANLIQEIQRNENTMSDVMCEVSGGKLRKISKTSIESIKKYLCQLPDTFGDESKEI